MKALLAKGADPDKPDPGGLTPLRIATTEGYYEGVLKALSSAKKKKADADNAR